VRIRVIRGKEENLVKIRAIRGKEGEHGNRGVDERNIFEPVECVEAGFVVWAVGKSLQKSIQEGRKR